MLSKIKNLIPILDVNETISSLTSNLVTGLISVEKWPKQALVIPRIQAHRGYWKSGLQENTLEAFREARRRGALMFECDVQLSKDQIPVIFHDENLQRLASRPEMVRELSAQELKSLANIPTLQEVLMDPEVPRLANLELKTKILVDDALERKVAEVVRSVRAESRVLFSSFNPMSLFRIGLHLPNVPRALLVSPQEDPDNSILLRKMWLAPFFSFHLLHLDQMMVTEQTMQVWRKKRIPIAVWTVNNKEEIQRFLKLGVMSVITDEGYPTSEGYPGEPTSVIGK